MCKAGWSSNAWDRGFKASPAKTLQNSQKSPVWPAALLVKPCWVRSEAFWDASQGKCQMAKADGPLGDWQGFMPHNLIPMMPVGPTPSHMAGLPTLPWLTLCDSGHPTFPDHPTYQKISQERQKLTSHAILHCKNILAPGMPYSL